MSSSTTDPGNRSSAQIEREVESTRAELTDTLDTLRDRVSPGNLMDQAVEYLRGSGGQEFVSNLGSTVRDNPVPVLLIGAGVGWLLMSGGKSSAAADARLQRAPARARAYPLPHTDPSPGPQRAGTPTPLPHRSSGGDGHEDTMAERARAAASGMAGKIGGAANQAYDSVADAVGSAGHMAERAGDLAHDAADYTARTAQQGMNWLLHEQPMVLGGIGLAIGAAIGAMLPSTSAENRMMGEASDEAARRLKDAAHEGYQRVQEVAGETVEKAKNAASDVYEGAKDRLDATGVSASKVGDALGAAGSDLANAASKVVHDAADGVRDTMKESDRPRSPGNDTPRR